MAYFNHAFYKSFLVDDVAGASVKTQNIPAGTIGLVSGATWATVVAATDPGQYFLVQGSYHTKDTIGNNPGHGGYTESVKSKGINPRFVTRMWASDCITATQSETCVTVGPECVPCDKPLYLRIDVKGSPALRFLNRNSYALGDSGAVCCAEDQEFVDPALALAKAGEMLLADPLIAPFVAEKTGGGITVTATALNAVATVDTIVAGATYVTATNVVPTGGTGTGLVVNITAVAGEVTAVTIVSPGSGYTVDDKLTIPGGNGNATFDVATLAQTAVFTIAEVLAGNYAGSVDPVGDAVTASLCLVGAYVDTKFGNCSFDTRDFYEKEPIQIMGSVVDETGDPCNDCGTTVNTPGTMQQTTGETVLRELLLTEGYMQSPFNQGNLDSNRMREIEGSNDILNAVDRDALYKAYYVQHSIPRLMNPTSTFDNDQYVYQIFVKCSDTEVHDKIETMLELLAAGAEAMGNPITPDWNEVDD